MKSFVFLALAIIAEATGTTALNMSQQFTKPVPSVVTVLAYGCILSSQSVAEDYPDRCGIRCMVGCGDSAYRCHRGCGFQAGSGSSGCYRHGADYRRCPDYQSYVQDVGTLKVTEVRGEQRWGRRNGACGVRTGARLTPLSWPGGDGWMILSQKIVNFRDWRSA